jgi:AsmA protein
MKKILKYSAFTLAGILGLLILGVAILAATFNPNDYKQQIIDIVKAKKERTLKLDGDISLSFWPGIGANLGKVSLSEHKGDKEFAALNSVKVSLALLPLLKKQLIVDTIYIDGARANIVRYKDGTTNLDDLLSKDEEESETIKFDIDGIIITDSAASFSDEKTGGKYAINKFNLKTGHVALAQPVDV